MPLIALSLEPVSMTFSDDIDPKTVIWAKRLSKLKGAEFLNEFPGPSPDRAMLRQLNRKDPTTGEKLTEDEQKTWELIQKDMRDKKTLADYQSQRWLYANQILKIENVCMDAEDPASIVTLDGDTDAIVEWCENLPDDMTLELDSWLTVIGNLDDDTKKKLTDTFSKATA